jgi:hypothetical protein
MAASTKYQPAPQRDSLEESSYAQPPPSYQQDDHAALLGAPRSEDDNLPDDFKVRTLMIHIGLNSMLTSPSLVASCQRRLSTSECSLSAKFMPSCKILFSLCSNPELTLPQYRTTVCNRRRQLCFILQHRIQTMDPKQCMDDVSFPLWIHRLHAPYLLETQILPNEPYLPFWLYSYGSILYLRHHILLRQQDCD